MAKHIRGRYEGSISQPPSGHWRAQTTPINGHRITRTFKTKLEALTWLRDTQSELTRGFDYQGSKTLLKNYLHDWLKTSRIALRPKTADSYSRTMDKHIIPNLGEVPLKDLTPFQVEKFYAGLIEKGVGIRTVRLVHSILHCALERAVLQSLLTRNPASHAVLPRYKHGEMKVLDDLQVNQFLLAAIDSPFVALYHLAVKTGMRMGELLGLRWSDLLWGSGRLYVQRQLQDVRGMGSFFQEPKTSSGRRTLQLGEGTIQALREHSEFQHIQKEIAGKRWQDNDLIFPSKIGTPLNPSNLRLDFNRVLERAGVPRVRFHDLRHTSASLMLNNGIPVIVVSKILGHSKPSITLDIYGHLYNEMQGDVARLMDELVSPIKFTLPRKVYSGSSRGELISNLNPNICNDLHR
jgi:integrase